MSKEDRQVLGYLCGTDFDYELGECDITIYATEESLKEKTKCWEQCGIVELGVENGQFKPIWIKDQVPFSSRAGQPIETIETPIKADQVKPDSDD